MNVKSKSGLRGSRKIVLITVLLVVLLVSSLVVYVLLVDNKGVIHVKSEAEFRRAIDGVKFGESATIVLDSDITLIGSIIIPVGRDITLMSNRGTEFFKLFGPDGDAVLGVESGGVLQL